MNSPLLIGTAIVHLQQTDSTNNEAKRCIRENRATNGMVIFTDTQTHGRGQYGNIWHSESGKNLNFSIIFFPALLHAKEQFLLSQTVSIAIVEFLKTKTNLPVSIKWPNDILVNEEKICGILIENNISGSRISESIIGIGLNVRQTDFPSEIKNVTSLQMLGCEVDALDSLLKELLSYLDAYFVKLAQGQYALIRELYLQQLFRYGISAEFYIGNQKVNGIIEGVNETGQLLLRINDELKVFNNKEVVFVIK